jgi:hypothetical protein
MEKLEGNLSLHFQIPYIFMIFTRYFSQILNHLKIKILYLGKIVFAYCELLGYLARDQSPLNEQILTVHRSEF